MDDDSRWMLRRSARVTLHCGERDKTDRCGERARRDEATDGYMNYRRRPRARSHGCHSRVSGSRLRGSRHSRRA